MPYYMAQVGYKDEQVKALISNPQNRAEEARKVIEAFGGKLHHFSFAFGESDLIIIAEAPDNESMAAIAMAVTGAGTASHFRTTVLLTMDEAVNAMKKAGSVVSGYKAPSGQGNLAAF